MTGNSSQGSEIILDVREELKSGREPFSLIMEAAEKVPLGGVLILYATFKPTPLLAVLGGQGFESDATPIENGDWKIEFRRIAAPPDQPHGMSPDESEAGGNSQSSGEIQLDNRGLEPPEPMVRTLEAINTLEPGGRIVGQFDRQPMFLLPKLEQMGFTYEVTQHDDGSATVIITSPDTK